MTFSWVFFPVSDNTGKRPTASLHTTAWRRIMAHASNWHKTEVKIFNNNGSLSPTLAHFRLTNKEVNLPKSLQCLFQSKTDNVYNIVKYP